MAGYQRSLPLYRLLTPLRLLWLSSLLLFTAGGLFILARDALRIDRALGPVALGHVSTARDLSNLQRELLLTQIKVKGFRMEAPTPGTPYSGFRLDSAALATSITRSFEQARAHQQALSARLGSPKGSTLFPPEMVQTFAEMQRQFTITDRLVTRLQRPTLTFNQQVAILGELDTDLIATELLVGELAYQQTQTEIAVISDARLVTRASRLSLGLVGLVLAAISGSLLLSMQHILKVEWQANERFYLAASAVSGAIYDWDMLRDHLVWTDGLTETFGYYLGEVQPTIKWRAGRIHPDDLPRFYQQLQEDVAAGRDFVCEYRFCTRDGTYLDVWDRGRVVRDATGRATRMVGSMADITERKRAEQALRESERKYAELVQEAPDPIISLNTEGCFESFNPAAERVSGYAAEQLLGKHFTAQPLVALGYLPKVVTEFELLIQGNERPPFELEIVNREGGVLAMEANPRCIQRDGTIAAVQLTLRDISERKAFEEQ
nr:PAS domain S-box protein [Ardenticatenales bacterium]